MNLTMHLPWRALVAIAAFLIASSISRAGGIGAFADGGVNHASNAQGDFHFWITYDTYQIHEDEYRVQHWGGNGSLSPDAEAGAGLILKSEGSLVHITIEFLPSDIPYYLHLGHLGPSAMTISFDASGGAGSVHEAAASKVSLLYHDGSHTKSIWTDYVFHFDWHLSGDAVTGDGFWSIRSRPVPDSASTLLLSFGAVSALVTVRLWRRNRRR